MSPDLVSDPPQIRKYSVLNITGPCPLASPNTSLQYHYIPFARLIFRNEF